MKKNVFFLVIIYSLVVVSAVSSKNVENYAGKGDKSTRYISSLRLSQTKQEFKQMSNVKRINTSESFDKSEPMGIGSANIGSKCIGSGCYGSICAGSLCYQSKCGGSACVSSKCYGSICVSSSCSSTGNCDSPTGIGNN